MKNPPSTRVIVTCGPAAEPIDQARCITNFSTGELGSLLSEDLAAQGWEVFCLRGIGATYPPPRHAQIFPFSTNVDLEKLFHQFTTSSPPITAIFHAAALCDFLVVGAENHRGEKIDSPKLNSQLDVLRLLLAPAPKLIRKLREEFPNSKIVGWKYELEGLPSDALTRGIEQIKENKTDACVVNGQAWGNSFAFLDQQTMALAPTVIPTKSQLCTHLAHWLAAQFSSSH